MMIHNLFQHNAAWPYIMPLFKNTQLCIHATLLLSHILPYVLNDRMNFSPEMCTQNFRHNYSWPIFRHPGSTMAVLSGTAEQWTPGTSDIVSTGTSHMAMMGKQSHRFDWMWVYVHVYLYLGMYVYVCMYLYVYTCMYMYVYTCMYLYVYVYLAFLRMRQYSYMTVISDAQFC
jgi:hypothetical protein